ncbi:MAG: hypothetical protein WA175_08340 [Candidatus Acidiferrales bacterium]
MAQSILIFDFGSNEDAAQQARHKLEGWTQAFRLGKKILLKFDRERSAEDSGKDGGQPSGTASVEGASGEGKSAKGKAAPKKSAAKAATKQGETKDAKEPASSGIRLLVRLDFSGHEKLSHHRWLARIPSEEPFKSAKREIILHTDPGFALATERFDSLS